MLANVNAFSPTDSQAVAAEVFGEDPLRRPGPGAKETSAGYGMLGVRPANRAFANRNEAWCLEGRKTGGGAQEP